MGENPQKFASLCKWKRPRKTKELAKMARMLTLNTIFYSKRKKRMLGIMVWDPKGE